VPESDKRIQQFAVADDQVFVTRVDRFSTNVDVFGLDAGRKEVPHFPSCGTIDLLNRTTATDKLFYSYTSISKPAAVYCYDARRKDVSTWNEANAPVDLPAIAVEETAYTSTDGTSVPLFLAARKNLLRSSPLPTFLTGYGGFGSCVTPRFTAFATFLMEQGFLFAVPALRGGSELGEQWHHAGKRENRQNSFNDFVAAAEWLIRERRSISGHIAIGGGSNAGLLVGAAITQRPDLFSRRHLSRPVARHGEISPCLTLPPDGLTNTGRQRIARTFDPSWPTRPTTMSWTGSSYPAVFLISGDADTRCNPMHARKMAARLQAATGSTHPVLLDYRAAWGHTPVQPHSTKIEALTDRLAFVCHELGVRVQPGRSL
jgi:prolyl oligopeptidase